MVLDARNIVHYLLGRGLITRESVVVGDFVAIELLRRNRNFKIRRTQAPGLFVKQVRSETPDMIATLEREARCYDLARSHAGFAAVASLMPAFLHYDDRNHVLILELLSRNENLRQHRRRLRRFTEEVGEQLGFALGRCHAAITDRHDTRPELATFPRRAPWILSFHSLRFDRGSPGGAIAQLHSLLRRYPDLVARLDELRTLWRNDCLIHGDVRWDNCLMSTGDDGDGAPNLKLVDWELADFGDPCWDIGTVFHGYLASWVSSMPDSRVAPSSVLVERAECRLEDIQPSIGAFWRGYTAAGGLVARSARDFLDRSIRYCAACMVQTAYELSVDQPQLPAFGIRLLQLSDNILANPEDAAAQLLAL